jgi:hypothetical protein
MLFGYERITGLFGGYDCSVKRESLQDISTLVWARAILQVIVSSSCRLSGDTVSLVILCTKLMFIRVKGCTTIRGSTNYSADSEWCTTNRCLGQIH